jgi:hypothetical protein
MRKNGRRRREKYYKVQVFDAVSLTWSDEAHTFDGINSANEYISRALDGKQSRIMVIEDGRRYPLSK